VNTVISLRFHNGWKFLDQLRETIYYLLKIDSAPWSLLITKYARKKKQFIIHTVTTVVAICHTARGGNFITTAILSSTE
jgi:hypothetical protein